MSKIYLDNSCTSYPKPPEVIRAVSSYMKDYGMNISRGSYGDSFRTDDIVFDTRKKICDLFNADDMSHIIFTSNVTTSLNMIINGFFKTGDHVLVSSLEHNAVMRPLVNLKSSVQFDRIPASSCGDMDVDSIESMIKEHTRAIICTHVSNVCGTINPLAKIGNLCKRYGLRFIVDSAQSAGVLPLDMKAMHIDALCFTGHKSLMGPQGIGGFAVTENMAAEIRPVICGGTGSVSDKETMPDFMPDKYEPGTLNLPGIFGLHAALEWLDRTSMKSIREHELKLTEKFLNGIKDISHIHILGHEDMINRLGVVSLYTDNMDIADVSNTLDKKYNILTRVGLHCAPIAHKTLGSFPRGSIRFSFGYYNTVSDIDASVKALKEIVSGL